MSDISKPGSGEPAAPPQGSASLRSRLELSRALDELVAGASRAPAAGETGVEAEEPSQPSLRRCPQPSAWSLLLSGEAQPFEADELLTHAALCSACAGHLRSLAEDPSEAELSTISAYSSSTGAWQRSFAVRLAATRRKPASQSRASVPNRYIWSGLAAAAAMVLAVGGFIAWRAMNSPERLIAKAYGRQRIYEFRIPGAAFAAVTPQLHLRGGTAAHEPAPLLEARAHIEKQLESAPGDGRLLQLQARAELLAEDYDPAIDVLDRLLARGPVTSSLLTDAATAYFERGAATGSEGDRSTALEYLRRADELTPGDPVVLFNEALAMEDRAQIMNAVETWNRYLRFERDPLWLAEGRRHLESLEQKLNQIKTHQSRIDGVVATPQARRALAADPVMLAGFDEELATQDISRLLDLAFPLPVDRSRCSPCGEPCLSARALLHALAASLERNHQDSWLTQLLPSRSAPPQQAYFQAIHWLAASIREDRSGRVLEGKADSIKAVKAFSALRNPSGEERARLELSYSYDRNSDAPGCYREAHSQSGRNPRFVWPTLFALTEEHTCDPTPNSIPEDDPAYWRIADLARSHRYTLVEMRARSLIAAAAVDAGDTELAWRVYLPVVREALSKDLPPIRIYYALMGLQQAEQISPRVRTAYLLERETLGVLGMTLALDTIPAERFRLAATAIRIGHIPEAAEQMRLAQAELAAGGNEKSLLLLLSENELLLAHIYLERGDLVAAGETLDKVLARLPAQRNGHIGRLYAEERAQLELMLGRTDNIEPALRSSLFEEEKIAGVLGAANIARAQDDRPLYALLAAVWLAEGRSAQDVLALWERYRMRILGIPVPVCAGQSFPCAGPALGESLARLGAARLLGQIVLEDRVLIYRADASGVTWTEFHASKSDGMAAAEALERSVTSPSTPMAEVDQAAQRVGSLFLGQIEAPFGAPGMRNSAPDAVSGSVAARPASAAASQAQTPPAAMPELLLEPDPVLGNLPWPSVETAAGPIGLRFNLSESPSLLLDGERFAVPAGNRPAQRLQSPARPLIVGASVAADRSQTLPEVLDEARFVAGIAARPTVLLGADATPANVLAWLPNASMIHFAGHAAEKLGATRLLLAQPGGAPSASDAGGEGGDDVPSTAWLDSRLIRSHPPRSARLAVFSACSSGKKEPGWNHGMGDIVAALASTGVQDVVATRWPIDSGSAIPLMRSFYESLGAGQTVPQALTSARLSLRSDPRYRHPYYWAAWYASGLGGKPLAQIFQR